MNVFTTSAVDNLDHNPSSTTASNSFHGTAISLTNHLSDAHPRVKRDVISTSMSALSKGIPNIPTSYTIFAPASLHNKQPVVPQYQGNVKPTGESISEANRKDQWLSKVAANLSRDCFESDDSISWAAFHASLQPDRVVTKANIAVLPLFYENAHSVAMITKSDLLPCLEQLSGTVAASSSNDITARIIDGAAIVNMRKPKLARTFGEYADNDMIPFFKSQLVDVVRLDVVWDQYVEHSLKEEVRVGRGVGSRRRVLDNTVIPKNWASFLRNNTNKKELFCFLAEKLASQNVHGKQIYTTHLDKVLSTSELKDEIDICNHEEADTRMLLHAFHAATHGHSKVVLRTVDTDVLVLAVAHFQHLQLAELWLDFGVGKNHRMIPAHSIAVKIGHEKASALPFFHALTGSDTTSAFAVRGKKTAWDVWGVYPEITATFSLLSSSTCHINEEMIVNIERFVVLLYSRSSDSNRVNEARRELFVRGTRSLENIPPTHTALIQHIKRAVYQAGYVWGQSLLTQQELPSPGNWGWEECEGEWIPKWTDLPEACVACHELIRCGCKKSCHGRCKCYTSNLSCTSLCACLGHCDRQ